MALIKCPECSKEISDQAMACPGCGCPLSHRSNLQEIVLKKGLCNYVKNFLYVQNGSAILTNKRFIYLKHSLAKIASIGILANLTEGSFDFEVPLNQIESLNDGRQGISKTIIINTIHGERYNFYFTGREEWKILLQSAIEGARQ